MPSLDIARADLKTGDLVLFSGKSRFSNLIKTVSGGKWSHVGMVIVEPKLHPDPLLWEATMLCDVPDISGADATPGVQLVTLAGRLAAYDGEVTWRSLSRPLEGPHLERFAGHRTALANLPYERSKLELARAVYDGWGGTSPAEDLTSIYCAELVAEAYQVMGILPDFPVGLPSNEYVPHDFSEEQALALLGGFTLGPEIPLTVR